jgi:hypothetical protein
LLATLETVAYETPAWEATSIMVTLVFWRLPFRGIQVTHVFLKSACKG